MAFVISFREGHLVFVREKKNNAYTSRLSVENVVKFAQNAIYTSFFSSLKEMCCNFHCGSLYYRRITPFGQWFLT